MVTDEIYSAVLERLAPLDKGSLTVREAVCDRICQTARRFCDTSQRIQDSGDVQGWTAKLATYLADRYMSSYRLGSRRGREELHSTLGGMIYRYITVPSSQPTHLQRVALIEDFLQGFYHEALNAFCQENQLANSYRPRTRLELAEFIVFTERYGKRRVTLDTGRTQALIVLQVQTFSQERAAPAEETAPDGEPD